MTKPEDIPDEEFGLRAEDQTLVETLFEAAIAQARLRRRWPAEVERPMRADGTPDVIRNLNRNALIAVAHRYRSIGWQVTLDGPMYIALIQRI